MKIFLLRSESTAVIFKWRIRLVQNNEYALRPWTQFTPQIGTKRNNIIQTMSQNRTFVKRYEYMDSERVRWCLKDQAVGNFNSYRKLPTTKMQW